MLVGVTVVVACLIAALLFAGSAALQQRAAGDMVRDAPPTDGGWLRWLPVFAVFTRIVRDKRWRLGWLISLPAFALHLVALRLGPITTVQGLLLTQLVFAQLMQRHRPVRRDWFGTAVVCTGLALLLLVRHTAPDRPHRGHVPLATLVVALGIGALIVIARLLPARLQWLRGAVVGAGAGMCFSLTAVFIVLAGEDLARGGPGALVTDWIVLGIAGTTSLGTVLVQDAFGAGSLPIALTAMTIADPVSSAVIDLLVLDPGQPSGPLVIAAYTFIGVILTAGVVILVTSPTRRA